MTELLKRAYDPDHFRQRGHDLVDRLADYLDNVAELSANPHTEAEQLLQQYRDLLGGDAGATQAWESAIANSVHLHHPDYMGHQVVPPAPLAALSDLVSSLLNTGMAVYEMGRPGVVIERTVIERFARMLGLAPTAGGFLTSGGSLANLTALLAARARQWPAGDPWQSGNADIKPCLLVNEQAHYCIERAVRIMGWGEQGIVTVPTDGELRMRTELIDGLLWDARSRGLTPIAIVGSACTTSTGTFDPLDALADAATRHGLWLHVDGAHGAAVRLDPGRQQLTRGLERADSVTLDFHKMLLAPALTTALFFREDREAYRTFQQRADYLLGGEKVGEEDWSNVARRSFECTKRMLGLRVYTLLAEYGPELFRDYVVRVNELGRELAALIRRRHPELQLFMQPDTNIVCFRFTHPALGAGARDAVNQLIRSTIMLAGERYIVQTRINGATYLRCTLTNAFTTTENLERMLDQVVTLGRELVTFRQNIQT